MAKTNYKVGEKIRVIKPGVFKDLEGEVNSVGNSDLPIKVDLGVYGTWNFNSLQIELIKNNNNEQKQNRKPGAK
jgi:transcription antitermination factor NusG